MKYVSLVGTVHGEKGLANIPELYAILERIRPEVIFLEMPSTAFIEYFDVGTRWNLESIAVRRYRDLHNVKLVPVDLPTPEEEFFKKNQYLHKKIEDKSYEYRQLIDWHSRCVSLYGFSYLNSEHHGIFWSDLHKVILATIESLNDHRLVELNELWNKTMELRDKKMIKNVEEYCRQNAFEKGAFLVGASHRQSIIDKLMRQSLADSPKIRWDFAGFVDEANREREASSSTITKP
jgi:hypothetical protein